MNPEETELSFQGWLPNDHDDQKVLSGSKNDQKRSSESVGDDEGNSDKNAAELHSDAKSDSESSLISSHSPDPKKIVDYDDDDDDDVEILSVKTGQETENFGLDEVDKIATEILKYSLKKHTKLLLYFSKTDILKDFLSKVLKRNDDPEELGKRMRVALKKHLEGENETCSVRYALYEKICKTIPDLEEELKSLFSGEEMKGFKGRLPTGEETKRPESVGDEGNVDRNPKEDESPESQNPKKPKGWAECNDDDQEVLSGSKNDQKRSSESVGDDEGNADKNAAEQFITMEPHSDAKSDSESSLNSSHSPDPKKIVDYDDDDDVEILSVKIGQETENSGLDEVDKIAAEILKLRYSGEMHTELHLYFSKTDILKDFLSKVLKRNDDPEEIGKRMRVALKKHLDGDIETCPVRYALYEKICRTIPEMELESLFSGEEMKDFKGGLPTGEETKRPESVGDEGNVDRNAKEDESPESQNPKKPKIL